MNKIIFSEGKRDTEFLSELVNRYANNLNVDRLDIPSGPSDTRNPRETNKIREFCSRRNPHDVLLKSEGGVPNLLDTLPIMLMRIKSTNVDLQVLIDLDGGELADIRDEINKRLKGRSHGSDIYLESCGEIKKYHFVATQQFTVIVNGKVRRTVGIAGFRESLEAVANIDKVNDSDDEMDKKARDAVNDERIRKPILRVLFNS